MKIFCFPIQGDTFTIEEMKNELNDLLYFIDLAQVECPQIASHSVASSSSQYNIHDTDTPENVQYNVYQGKMESSEEEELVGQINCLFHPEGNL